MNLEEQFEFEIFIPEKINWLNKTTLNELIKLKVFDDSENIDDHIKIIQQYDIPENRYEKIVKNLGIWVSGGADSSLLMYLLTRQIKQKNLPYKIHPFSVRRGRPWNPFYAQNVIDFINVTLDAGDIINDVKVYYPPIDDIHQREIKEFMDRDTEHFNNDIIDVMYSGITCNPPHDEVSPNKETKRDRNSERPLIEKCSFRYFINPFFKYDKKDLANIYAKLNLVHTLFPLTRSCEGNDIDTGYYTKHCGKCWWCEERMWAFGRLE